MELHFEYYVIEFLHQPYLNVERLVCVPTSWIEANAYGPSDRRVAVAFPAEPLAATIRHVRDKRPPHRAWSWYCALIKFGNDDYIEAQKYIMKNTNDQKRKLNTKTSCSLNSVKRTFNKSVSLEKPHAKKKLKEAIRRTYSSKQIFRGSMVDISNKKLLIKRPTVIKTTNYLKETDDLNINIENPKYQLIAVDDNVKTYTGISSPGYKTHNKTALDSANQLATEPVTLYNRGNSQEVHTNCSHEKLHSQATVDSDKMIVVNRIKNFENSSKYQSSFYPTNAIEQSDKQSNHSHIAKPYLLNPRVIPNNIVTNNDQNSALQCSCKDKDKHYLPPRYNEAMQYEPFLQSQCKNCTDSSCPSSKVFNDFEKKSTHNETYTLQAPDENGNCYISNSPKLYTKSSKSTLQRIYNILDKYPAACNNIQKNIDPTDIENNPHLKPCTHKIINSRTNQIYPREQCADISVPPSGSGVTNLSSKHFQIAIAPNSKQYSPANRNKTFKYIPSQKTTGDEDFKSKSSTKRTASRKTSTVKFNNLENCIKHNELYTSYLNNKITEFGDRNDGKPPSQFPHPLLLKQFSINYSNNCLSNLHRKENITEDTNKYIDRPCSRTIIGKELQSSPDNVVYESREIIRDCRSSIFNHTVPKNRPTECPRSLYNNKLSLDYLNHRLSGREDILSGESYIKSSTHQSKISQHNAVKEPYLSREQDFITYSNSQHKEHLGKPLTSNFYLANVTNNPPYAEYPMIGLNRTSLLEVSNEKAFSPDQEKYLQENVCTQQILSKTSTTNNGAHRTCIDNNKNVLKCSKDHVVDDPRKANIKKVIKVKPMNTEDYFPTNKRDSFIKYHSNSMASTVDNHISKYFEKSNKMQHITDKGKTSPQSMHLHDSYSTKINVINSSNKKSNAKSTYLRVSNSSQNDNIIFDDISVENTNRNGLPSYGNNKLVSKTKRLIKKSQSDPPVCEKSILLNNLSTINCSNQKNGVNYKINYDDGNDKNIFTLTPNRIYKPENNVIQKKENDQNKNEVSDVFSSSTKRKTNRQAGFATVSIDDHNTGKFNKNKSDENDGCSKKTVRNKRSYVLPPEYKPKNSKWTLKYQRASLGVVELVPGTCVYVDENRLCKCLIEAWDYNMLARRLLLEIFSENALSVCSFSGVKNTINETRPGLDEGARLTLLEYVEEHGRANGWGPMNGWAVMKCLRNKVYKVRAKYYANTFI